MTDIQPRRTKNGKWQAPHLFTYDTEEQAIRATNDMVAHPEWMAMGKPNSYWLETWTERSARFTAEDKREIKREKARARRQHR